MAKREYNREHPEEAHEEWLNRKDDGVVIVTPPKAQTTIAPSWKDEFASHILARGKKYYEEGRVSQIIQYGNRITAHVDGTEDYCVEIDLPGGVPDNWLCTCPYAAEDNCKHMAALLFAVEAENYTFTDEEPERTSRKVTEHVPMELPWLKAIDNLPEAVVRKKLMQLADRDDRLKERLAFLYLGGLPEGQLINWKADLQEKAFDATNRRGIIEYDDADIFFMDLQNFLSEKLSMLLEANAFMDAVQMVWIVLKTAMEQVYEEPDGSLQDLKGSCEEAWETIFESSPDKIHQQMLDWFWSVRKEITWSYGIDSIEIDSFFMTLPWQEHQHRSNLQLLDREIETSQDDGSNVAVWLSLRAEIMELLEESPAAILAFWKEHSAHPYARRKLIRHYMETDKSEAIALLEKSKILDKDNINLLTFYCRDLANLYYDAGDYTRCVQELKELLIDCGFTELKYVGLLKQLTPQKQWPALVQQMLTATSSIDNQLSLLEYEKRYEDMIEILLKEQSLWLYEEYYAQMREEAPDLARSCLIQLLNTAMESARNREEYARIIKYLELLTTIPDGDMAAIAVAEGWFSKYTYRRAMREELRMAGYTEW